MPSATFGSGGVLDLAQQGRADATSAGGVGDEEGLDFGVVAAELQRRRAQDLGPVARDEEAHVGLGQGIVAEEMVFLGVEEAAHQGLAGVQQVRGRGL